MLALLLSLGATASPVAPVGHIQLSQFTVGKTWTWQHSELNARTGNWEPFLNESYTVTQVAGSNLTIEMSSDPPSATSPSAPHHKFNLDFQNCEKSKFDPTKRKWTVQFFTTSLTGSWTLVSNSHPQYVFTEKFNCFTPDSDEIVQTGLHSLPDGTHATFHIERGITEDTSWYFNDHPEFKGVLAHKLFEPTRTYRAELLAR